MSEARRRGHHFAEGELHPGSLGCLTTGGCEVVPVPEEADLFRVLGMPYEPPAERRA